MLLPFGLNLLSFRGSSNPAGSMNNSIYTICIPPFSSSESLTSFPDFVSLARLGKISTCTGLRFRKFASILKSSIDSLTAVTYQKFIKAPRISFNLQMSLSPL